MRHPILASSVLLVLVPVLGLTRGRQGPDLTRDTPLVAVRSAASHPVVLAGSPQDVYLHVSLDAAELPEAPRPAMNLALVVDRSGSMASEDKLRFAKAAAEQLVARLRPDDRLALVSYDDRIETLVPSAPAAERERFLAAIRTLVPGNATDLCGGLTAGYEEVCRGLDAKRQNRVLLLSDGLANRGVTDPLEIRARAERFRERGVRVSTMGMGLAYDDVLMSGIAQVAGGNYYYVEESEAVGRYLDREIDELSRLVARDVEVRIELGDRVELLDVFGYEHRREGRVVLVPVEDLYSGEGRKVVLRLRVQGAAGERQEFARTSLRYVEVANGRAGIGSGPIHSHLFSQDVRDVELARDMAVLVKVEVVHDAEALLAAMRLQRSGRVDAAMELLSARYRTSKLLNDTEYRSAELTRILNRMKQVLHDLERTRSDPDAGRDLQLLTDLQALGYVGEE